MSALTEIVTFEPGDGIRREACVPALRLPFAAQDVDGIGWSHAGLRANVVPRHVCGLTASIVSTQLTELRICHRLPGRRRQVRRLALQLCVQVARRGPPSRGLRAKAEVVLKAACARRSQPELSARMRSAFAPGELMALRRTAFARIQSEGW